MRVSDRTQSRNFLKGLNDVMYKRMQSQDRLLTSLRYQNMSDNVSATSRSLRADLEAKKIGQQLSGIENAGNELNAADETLQAIIDVFTEAKTTMTKAVDSLKPNSTGDVKMSALIGQIKNFKEEILQFTNSQFSGKFMFGGTNSANAPYSVGTDGKVLYNGIPVDSIMVDPDTRDYYYLDENTNEKIMIPQDEDVYLDVGRGIQIDAGKIDPGSAFKISFSGLDILGSGFTVGEDGFEMSNNIYNLLNQAQTIMEKYAGSDTPTPTDEKQLNELFGHIGKRFDALVNNETEVGGRANFLERMGNRLTDQTVTLENLKKSLVGTKEEEETTTLAGINKAYSAAIALGGTMFQKSLIDFLR